MALRGGIGTQLPLTVTARWMPWLRSAVSLELRPHLWVKITWENRQWLSCSPPLTKSDPLLDAEGTHQKVGNSY